MRVFAAGAAGAIRQWLVPALVPARHAVVATTRFRAKIEGLRALGAEPVLLDGLDAVAVGETVGRAAPDVIVHQMTALAGMGGNLRKFDRYFATTNELRTAGTGHLLAAAAASGVPRFVAQSFTGWPNTRQAAGVKTEQDPLDGAPPDAQTPDAQTPDAQTPDAQTPDAVRDPLPRAGGDSRAAARRGAAVRLAVRARRLGEVRGDDPRPEVPAGRGGHRGLVVRPRR